MTRQKVPGQVVATYELLKPSKEEHTDNHEEQYDRSDDGGEYGQLSVWNGSDGKLS